MDKRYSPVAQQSRQDVDWDSIFSFGDTGSDLTTNASHTTGTTQEPLSPPLASRNPFRKVSPVPFYSPPSPQVPASINASNNSELEDLEAQEIELELKLLRLRKQRILQTSPRIGHDRAPSYGGSEPDQTHRAAPSQQSSYKVPENVNIGQHVPTFLSSQHSDENLENSLFLNRPSPSASSHVSASKSQVRQLSPLTARGDNVNETVISQEPTSVVHERAKVSLSPSQSQSEDNRHQRTLSDPELQDDSKTWGQTSYQPRSLESKADSDERLTHAESPRGKPILGDFPSGEARDFTYNTTPENHSILGRVASISASRVDDAELEFPKGIMSSGTEPEPHSPSLNIDLKPEKRQAYVHDEDSEDSSYEPSYEPSVLSGHSMDTPASSDHQLAMEIAAQEASTYVDEGRLNEMHPLLQEQLAEAIKHYMPDDTASSQGQPSDFGSRTGSLSKSTSATSDIASFKSSSTLEESNSLDLDSREKLRAETSNPLAKFLSKVGTGKKPTDPNTVRRVKIEEPVSKAEESTNIQFEDSESEEDLCYCGKAIVGKDPCYYCWPCDGAVYCDECWGIPPPHRENHKRSRFARATGQKIIHEKSDPASARKIVEALQSDHSLEHQAFLHQVDEDTAWFGTGRDIETGDTVFQDFGRYSRIMAEVPHRDQVLRYPALVSFVGQTGAGKSSLIRLLVELYSPGETSPQVPVVGSTRRSDLPTSGDVHLYADLNTLLSEQPMLYADCEGLDGGEREPSGARLKKGRKESGKDNQRTNSFARNIRRQHHTSEREILWATDTLRKSREYHVRHLYPRLLYTFSDVIVFVMKNPRVVESVIEQLIRWAADALETSSNQPVLPHAIIVLNAYDNASDPAMWDSNESTINLMERVSRAVHQNHNIRRFAEFWRQKGRPIESVEMLLLSYYSSVRVVRVPERGRPKLINEQIEKLYVEIKDACNKSRASKHQLRMLLNSDELQPYLQYAFDHFSRNLEHPFDFVQASLSHNPTVSDFGGNILKLAIDIATVWKDKLDGVSIFKELSFMVASCIMVECARSRTLGSAEKMLGAYIHHWDTALEDFCDRHWPCEYVHPGTQGRCVNVKAGHTKGHQLKNGKVLSVGEYQSEFTFERYQEFFHYGVLHVLGKLLQNLSDATIESPQLELEKALEIHRTHILAQFFKHLHGSQHFVSHTACYSCLMAPPEHPLPCGHVLCTPCIKGYGSQRGRTLWEISRCPQHYDDDEGQFQTSWPIHIKPSGAGVRMLTLDGGGVRGIIELCILREIERKLGPGLPIQLFFDLIVGTSTGGIIALGLGANGWTVHKCQKTFEKLCRQAFTKRKGIGIPGIEHFVTVANDSRYETAPMEHALKAVFGEDQNLFAGSRDDLQDQAMLQRLTKVAVVTTTLAGTPALLGNYNRSEDPETISYQYHRSDKPGSEVKTWEAARATSAAPLFFKPYVHEPSGQTYQDGCLYHNNPIRVAIREQKLLWPDRAESCPDIILSIGTGVNEQLAVRKPAPKRSRFGLVRTFQNLASMATDHIQSSLNSEQMWKDFLSDSSPAPHLRERYQRLNLKMDHAPPKMDEVQKLERLKEMTLSRFTRDGELVKDIADRLLATSFYFALVPEETTVIDGQTCMYGMIHCRFPPGPQIRALGEALELRARKVYNLSYRQHRPYFVVQERRRESQAVQVMLNHEVTDKMVKEGSFTMNKIEIRVSDNNAETDILFCFGDRPKLVVFFPISGFPRCLPAEVDKALRRRFTQQEQRNFVKVKWESFEVVKASWKFDAADFFKTKDPLGVFSSAGYKNPGNAGDNSVQDFSDRYSVAPQRQISVSKRAELAVYNSDEELEFEEERKLNPTFSADEIIRQQWLRLYMSGVQSSVQGPPDTGIRYLYRHRPGLYPTSTLDLVRSRSWLNWSNDPIYSKNGRSALSKSVRGAPKLPGEPFELPAPYR